MCGKTGFFSLVIQTPLSILALLDNCWIKKSLQ